MEAAGWLLIVGVVAAIAVAPAFPAVRRFLDLSDDSPDARAVRRYLRFGRGWSGDDPTEALWAEWHARELEGLGRAPTFAYPEQPPETSLEDHRAATDLDLLKELRRSLAERGDTWGEANAWNLIGFVHERHGDFERALTVHYHALEGFEIVGDPSGIGDSLNNLGIVLGRMGQVKQAVERHRQALEIRGRSDSFRASNSHNNLGVLLAGISPHDAEEHFREAIRLWEQADDDAKGLGKLINNWTVLRMGAPRLRQKDGWLLTRFERALSLRRLSEDRRGKAKTQNNLGLIHTLRGNWMQAEEHFGLAAALAGGVEDRVGLLHILGNWLLLLRAGECSMEPEQIEARMDEVSREAPELRLDALERDCEAFAPRCGADDRIAGQVALFSSGSSTPKEGPELENSLQAGGSLA
jgi:tetratricopeptide (TPR) repeat protein